MSNTWGQDPYDSIQKVLAGVAKQWQQTAKHIATAVSGIQLPTETLVEICRQLPTMFPSNWPHPLPGIERLKEVLEEDGIPIVHIPREEIVRAIIAANDYEARMDIIRARGDDIAQDCAAALDPKYDEGLELQSPLARRAIEAFRAGHFEAAQALAVSVCDTYLKQMFPPEPIGKNNRGRRIGYPEMATRLTVEKSEDASATWAFNVGYALAPAVQFLADWWPEDEAEPPTRLSRHVSIHNASTNQMTRLNSIVAIMLVTSMSVALNYPMRLMIDSTQD